MTASVTLGGKTFALAPVTIGRLEAIEAALSAKTESSVKRAVGVVNAAIADGPIADTDSATLGELMAAMSASLAHAGFKSAAAPAGDPAGNV